MPQYESDDPEMAALHKRTQTAQRRGDRAEIEAVQEQTTRLFERRRKEGVEQLLGGEAGSVDRELVKLFERHRESFGATNGTDQTLLSEMAGRMGQLPLVNDRPAARDERFSVLSGLVIRKGSQIEIQWLQFNRIADGALALISWLCDRGCGDLKYEIRGTIGYPGEEE